MQEAFNHAMKIKNFHFTPKENRKATGYIGFRIYFEGPLMKTSGWKNNVRIDIALDEPVVDKKRTGNVIRTYPDFS